MAENISSVEKALRLLECITERSAPWGVAELTREMGMTKSNVHRLLQILCATGYLRHLPGEGRYAASLKLWELGARVAEGIDMREIAQRHLAELSATVHETVHLAVLEGWDAVYIDRIESQSAFQSYARIGSRAPASCVATGHAMLARFDDEGLLGLRGQLPAVTPNSITDFDELLKTLATVRSNGYAITRGSWRPGVFGVAAAVTGTGGALLGAVGMSCLDHKLTRQRIEFCARAVKDCAAAISSDCGGGTPATRPRAGR